LGIIPVRSSGLYTGWPEWKKKKGEEYKERGEKKKGYNSTAREERGGGIDSIFSSYGGNQVAEAKEEGAHLILGAGSEGKSGRGATANRSINKAINHDVQRPCHTVEVNASHGEKWKRKTHRRAQKKKPH